MTMCLLVSITRRFELFCFVCLFVFCPCRSNAAHRVLLSEVSIVMCVNVVSDQPTDRTSSTQS
jgi:hypothetical protein